MWPMDLPLQAGHEGKIWVEGVSVGSHHGGTPLQLETVGGASDELVVEKGVEEGAEYLRDVVHGVGSDIRHMKSPMLRVGDAFS